MSKNNNDSFIEGMIAAGILGLAAYGAYKILQNVTKSEERRLLEILGRDLERIDDGYGDRRFLLTEGEEEDDDENY